MKTNKIYCENNLDTIAEKRIKQELDQFKLAL